MIGLIVLILVSLFFAFILGYIADKRGAKVAYWALMGAILGPIAIPFAFIAKTKRVDKKERHKESSLTD
jgi:cadmium resistance protein CadD (predicted permease)